MCPKNIVKLWHSRGRIALNEIQVSEKCYFVVSLHQKFSSKPCFVLFIYFWLLWVFIAERGLFSSCGVWASGVAAWFQRTGSVVMAYRLTCPLAYGIFLDQGPNLCPLRWQVDSSTKEVLNPALNASTVFDVFSFSFSSKYLLLSILIPSLACRLFRSML